MQQQLKFYGFLLGGLLLLSSCEPTPDMDSLIKDMVVQTGFEQSANFSSYSTYSMPLDTIGLIYNVFPNDTIITGEYAQLISRTVKDNIDKVGYTMVSKNQNPDWGVNVYVIRNYNVYQSVVYPNYYYGRGYYGYSGYYSYPYVSTLATNSTTLVLEILDLKNKDSQGRVRVIWTAYIGDVVESVDSYLKSAEGVDQAFVQSAYIKK